MADCKQHNWGFDYENGLVDCWLCVNCGERRPFVDPDEVDRLFEDLRDSFAKAAMTGILSSLSYVGGKTIDQLKSTVAKSSYTVADAMLEAREKSNG